MGIKYIAEIAQSYEGDFLILLEIIEALGSTDVDYIMFQIIFADELATPENNNYNFFRNLEFEDTQLQNAILKIKELNKKSMGEVFGIGSANKMAEYGIDAIKIHPADASNHSFLDEVSRLNLPIFLGIGGCLEFEIQSAIEILSLHLTKPLTLMHGYQTCPTPIQESHFSKIESLKKFNCALGYSDHSPATINDDISLVNPLAIYSPSTVIPMGVKAIEKHVILDRTKKWEDYESALTPNELNTSINYMKSIEDALGGQDLQFNDSEKIYRQSSKKYIVAKEDIEADSTINLKNIIFKRIQNADVGIINYSDVKGKSLKKKIKKNEPITLDDII